MKVRFGQLGRVVLLGLIATIASCTNLNSGPDTSAESPRPVTGQLCDPPDAVCAETVTYGHIILEIVGATGIESRVERTQGSTTYKTSFVVWRFSAANIARDYRFTFEVRNRDGDALWKPVGFDFEDGARVLRFRGKSDLAIHDVTVRITRLKKEKIRVEAAIVGVPRR